MAAEGNIDLIVRRAFFARNKGGVLVEIGAARPDFLSIGQSFRARGWKVISIEPIPEFCAAHRAVGNEVLQYAVSDTESDDAEFTIVDSVGANYLGGQVSFESFSSLGVRGRFAALYEGSTDKLCKRTVRVKMRKLDTILSEHEPKLREIDILAADVEGWELNIMRGLTRFRPKVVILENLFEDPEYVSYMEQRGYVRWRRLAPNDVYVLPEKRASFVFRLWDAGSRLTARAKRAVRPVCRPG